MGNKKDVWGSAALSIALTIIPMTASVYCVLSFALIMIAVRVIWTNLRSPWTRGASTIVTVLLLASLLLPEIGRKIVSP
ncbi:MAG TPA: hypothetical protein VN788_11375 [Verrucomicrobiae bacterium]|nr:hypothetical protein [Verrucomicrobiae bacterium]